MTKLTVLMTVYNGMPYLKDAVESILAQTLTDFTFLILNNGSTDGTRVYLDSLSEDSRLCIEHLPENIGRTAVLNKGLGLIATEFTAIIDADDLSAPTRLQKQLALLETHPDTVLVGSDVTYVNRAGNPIGSDHFPPDHESLRDRLPLHNQFAHAACMFRTAAAVKAGGYPAAYPYAQDFALWIAMLVGGGRIASIPEPLASIRVHPGQATRDLKLLMVRCEDNRRLAQSMLAIPDISRAARQAAELRTAGALWQLARKKEALAHLWKGIAEAPALLPVNPLLWQRIVVAVKRRLHPIRP